jgi:hypothetical protein
MIIFRYSQPFLITYTIRYVSDAALESNNMDFGYQIILAAVLIYTGLAASQPEPRKLLLLIPFRFQQHLTNIDSIEQLQCSEAPRLDSFIVAVYN